MSGSRTSVPDPIWVAVEAAQRPCFALHPFAFARIQAVGLDQRAGDVAVEPHIVGAVDDFAAAFTQQRLHDEATVHEGSRQWCGGRRRRAGGLGFRCPRLTMQPLPRRSQVTEGICILRVQSECRVAAGLYQRPVAPRDGLLRFVEQPVDLPLNPVAGHDVTLSAAKRPQPARLGPA